MKENSRAYLLELEDGRSQGICVVGEIPGSMGKQVGLRRGITVCTCVVGEGSRTHMFVG